VPALITELIDKRDNFEIIRDQIAAILALELDNQHTLSGGQLQPSVFIERSMPWGMFLEGAPITQPVINVWFDTSTFDESTSNVVERQKCAAVFNVDWYGFAVSQDDTAGGHVPADEQAARETQPTLRLARKKQIGGPNTNIGQRGLVWKRVPLTMNMFQAQIDNRAAQRIVGARLALQVHFNEFAPQIEGVPLEQLTITFFRKETGQILVAAEYPPPSP
jgi:hypothetical protein